MNSLNFTQSLRSRPFSARHGSVRAVLGDAPMSSPKRESPLRAFSRGQEKARNRLSGFGAKLIGGLRDAVAGNFSVVVIEGQTWVRLREGDSLVRGEASEKASPLTEETAWPKDLSKAGIQSWLVHLCARLDTNPSRLSIASGVVPSTFLIDGPALSSTNRLREVRERFGLTQEQLADKLGGVHWVTISNLERGKLLFSLDWRDRIAGALGIDWSELGDHPRCKHQPKIDLDAIGKYLKSIQLHFEINGKQSIVLVEPQFNARAGVRAYEA